VLATLEPVRAVSSAPDQACAVRAEGRVACWSTRGDTTPRAVPGLVDAIGVHVGGNRNAPEGNDPDAFGCAWTRSGDAWCWGGDRWGQLGDAGESPEQWSEFTLSGR
jgi:hypothetical protein